MPCKGGYRKRIDESKRRREQERLHDQSTERKYWLDLVSRVHKTKDGFSGLSKPEKTYYAISCFIGEVYNGGFEQFFSNSSGDLYAYALNGLCELEAKKSAAQLIAAKEALFGERSVPIDRTERVNLMPRMSENSNESLLYSEQLDVLDKAFWSDPDKLAEQCKRFAIENALYRDE